MQKEEWDAEKNETVMKDEFETVNQASALWTRTKTDITDEQYDEVLQARRRTTSRRRWH